jgi:hypothetical protein
MMPSADVRDEINNSRQWQRDRLELPLASTPVTIALRKLPTNWKASYLDNMARFGAWQCESENFKR